MPPTPDDLRQDRIARRQARTLAAPHYKDGRFFNAAGPMKMDWGQTLGTTREFLTGGVNRRPPGPLPTVSPLAGWREQSRTGLRVTWLGHSTMLLEIDGVRVLTDPVWALRASPSQRFGPRRFHAPVVEIPQLPPLDAVLVSHDHYDHLDAAAVALLAQHSRATFFTALGVGARLESMGVPAERIVELNWWEGETVPGTELVIHATPAQHFSGRGALDRDQTLWASYVFQGPRHRVFFSGDTGLEPSFPRVRAEYGPFDLVMIEVGAWHPAWGKIHLGPVAAMEAHRQLGGGGFLPVHWSTFDLALHAWDEPIRVLEEAAHEAALPLVAPRLGNPVEVGDPDEIRKRLVGMDTWWREVV